MEDGGFALITPFENQSRDYALGVEFGRLYQQMRTTQGPIVETVHLDNVTQIRETAYRIGWHLSEVTEVGDGWVQVRLIGMVPSAGEEHCPHCGYTEADKRLHGDHHLCRPGGRSNVPGPKVCGTCKQLKKPLFTDNSEFFCSELCRDTYRPEDEP